MYKVYFLDGVEITGVEDVQFSHERDITIHDGLGQGKFPVPESKGLKSYTIRCQQQSKNLFSQLEKLLDSKEESRLVIVSNAENISEQVLLKSYDKQETSSGVYDVSIKFVEYVKACARTTGVPKIDRPGKMPAKPKEPFIPNGKNSAYAAALKASQEATKKERDVEVEKYKKRQTDLYNMEFVNRRTGKVESPCTLKDGDLYDVKPKMQQSVVGTISAWLNADIKRENSIEQNNEAMARAYADWQSKHEKPKNSSGGGSR